MNSLLLELLELFPRDNYLTKKYSYTLHINGEKVLMIRVISF